MKRRFVYTVEYRMSPSADVKCVSVIAGDKWEAYDKATYETIPEQEGCLPHNSWVKGITYQNGNYRLIAKGESMY